MQIDLDGCFRAVDSCIRRDVEGSSMLLEIARGTYFGLDAVGTQIWTELETGTTLILLVEKLHALYGTDRAILERDIADFLGSLVEQGLVVDALPEPGT